MKKVKKILISLLGLGLFIYLIVALVLFFNQKSMIYMPDDQSFEQCQGFADYQKINFRGTRFYYKENPSDKIIIYYHGNAGSACDRAVIKSLFELTNASIIFVEYAGYSNDAKKPDKKSILQDVQNVHDYVEQKKYSKIIVYGQSLGTAAASYQAYLGGVTNLILASPFSSLQKMVKSRFKIFPTSILLTQNYDNITYLKHYTNDLLILHGDKDDIILANYSKDLYDNLNLTHKKYVLIEGVGHNDMWTSTVFTNTLIKYLNSID